MELMGRMRQQMEETSTLVTLIAARFTEMLSDEDVVVSAKRRAITFRGTGRRAGASHGVVFARALLATMPETRRLETLCESACDALERFMRGVCSPPRDWLGAGGTGHV